MKFNNGFTNLYTLAAAGIILKSIFLTDLQAQDSQTQAYKVGVLPSRNVELKISPFEVSNATDAKRNLAELIRFAETRHGNLVVIDGGKDFLVEVKNGKIQSSFPIKYQIITDALSGFANIPSKNNSWDRLEVKAFENIGGTEYAILKQTPSDKTSWLSTRYNELFNYLRLKPGTRDVAAIKDIVAFNVKKQYGIDLDKDYIRVISRTDENGGLGIFDVIYGLNKDIHGKVIPENVVLRKESKTYNAKRGHILIQQDKEIFLPLNAIPRDHYPLEQLVQSEGITPTSVPEAAAASPDKTKPKSYAGRSTGKEEHSTKSEEKSHERHEKPRWYAGLLFGRDGSSTNHGNVLGATLGYSPSSGVDLEATVAKINLTGNSNKGYDSTWTSTYGTGNGSGNPLGSTIQKFTEKYTGWKARFMTWFGDKNLKLGFGGQYNRNKSTTESTVTESIKDRAGNQYQKPLEVQPTTESKNSYFSIPWGVRLGGVKGIDGLYIDVTGDVVPKDGSKNGIGISATYRF